ncbi:hypothetical protein FDECE_203 [Fusarium decemcellulare]|nr:hypothetical protein FDECE_203 [Fusarium decemcellulare]
MSDRSHKQQKETASASGPAAFGSRKHRKAFTGCWTCRARKIKCDEAKPKCLTCQAKNAVCEGYGLRLRWLPPEGLLPSSESPPAPEARSQRSLVAPGLDRLLSRHDEIDQILHTIDAFKPKSLSSFVEKSLYLHDFGVFDPADNSSSHQSSPPTESAPTTQVPFAEDDGGLVLSHHQAADNQSFSEGDLNCSFALLDSVLPIFDVGSDQPTENFCDFNAISQTSSTTQRQSAGAPSLDSRSEAVSGQDDRLTILESHCHWQELDGTIIRKPPTSRLPDVQQFLMYHYSHRVVNLFTVIDNRKSPWKTIHLPRVLQIVGHLSIDGSALMIQDALKNALLSISAFCLSNDFRSRFCVDEATRWAYQATLFRDMAIKSLKGATTDDLNVGSVPKYKDILATILSMITINVMSGDTDTCAVHLDGASRFIYQARTWKSKYSHKAQSLHRIYFYLRTIYESTAPASRINTISNFGIPDLIDFAEAPNEICTSSASSRSLESAVRMYTYVCIYGVPQNLLILLHKSTRLINEVTVAREKLQTADIPAHLALQCDELEKVIMDWPVEEELTKCNIYDMGVGSNIIRKATEVYHNALIIYFAQHIRLMGYRYLQPYVEVVLRSAEAIEQIKAQSHTLASPLHWPVFIAASEAFDKALQDRFRKWYDQIESYGLGSTRTGIDVLAQVWEENEYLEVRTLKLQSIDLNEARRNHEMDIVIFHNETQA